jgi:tRNA-specific 2-thiouridylase
MKNWEEDDEPGYCAAAEDLADARRRRATRHPAAHGQLRDRILGPRLRAFSGRVPRAAHAEPGRALQQRDQVPRLPGPCARPRRGLDRTGHYARSRARPPAAGCGFAPMRQGPDLFPAPARPGAARPHAVPAGGPRPSPRCAASPAGSASPTPRRRTAPASASSASGASGTSSPAGCRASPAPSRHPTGLTVGEHRGLAWYTIGQRSGLGIGGVRDAGEAPWFVAARTPHATR